MSSILYSDAAATSSLRSAPSLVVDFFSQLYSYREYLLQSVARDLRTKYKRSVLGYLWTMLHPLSIMLITSVVFSHILKIPIRDYSVFLFAGLLPWSFFHSTTLMSLGSMRANARLFGQVAMPKHLFVVSLAGSNLLNLVLSVAPLLIIMVLLDRALPLTIFALPLVLLPLVLCVLGIALALSACSVFFDDTLHLSEVALQALYFASPILYSREMLPPHVVSILALNPLFCQVEFFRGVFYSGELPALSVYLVNLGASALVLLVGLVIFKKAEGKFLYYV